MRKPDHSIVLAACDQRLECFQRALDRIHFVADLRILQHGEEVLTFFCQRLRKQRKLDSRVTRSNDLATDGRGECDLLFLDLQLPIFSGLTLLRQFRWMYRDNLAALPPIVVIADNSDSKTIASAYKYGASGLLCTSGSSELRFTQSVRKTMDYWLNTTIRRSCDLTRDPRIERDGLQRQLLLQ